MERRELTVEYRSKTGKGIARKIRANGRVPGIVYGKGIDPVPVVMDPKELLSAIAGVGGHNNLITLKGVAELNGKVVIVSDLFSDPLKGMPMHVDLHKINLEEKIKVAVPVNIVGNAPGVVAGGLLDMVKHTLEVECLPTEIPEHLDVDVTSLAIGQSIHVEDLVAPEGVKILDDPRAAVVSVLHGKVREETVDEEAGE